MAHLVKIVNTRRRQKIKNFILQKYRSGQHAKNKSSSLIVIFICNLPHTLPAQGNTALLLVQESAHEPLRDAIHIVLAYAYEFALTRKTTTDTMYQKVLRYAEQFSSTVRYRVAEAKFDYAGMRHGGGFKDDNKTATL